ncbi:hypothetical protein NM688_g4146 [Phlebia brevispora]|uniref:Uncharacterized protein n=1 Tax=Phlebia brevispora TaxID=194682 RepID=A0ACC1T4C9_9APHY|nr:hypothetical protein NM688_g4146 [Phlebia brevispora]
MGARVATWAMSGVQSDTWRVHSSLLLPEGRDIATLDCKSGLLAVGTSSDLSIYTLVLENDLPTWSLKWTLPMAGLSRVRFSPSLMYIASTSTYDDSVRIYLTTSGKQTQCIRHPRPVKDMHWRQSGPSSRDDLTLYTITSDATLRIFLPVLDAPQHVQLHASLDIFSALPFTIASQVTTSRVFFLDRGVMSDVLHAALATLNTSDEDARSMRLRDMKAESWDLFLRVLGDGSLIVQAVANIDRRPPTLLKQLTLLQTGPSTLPSPPSHLYVLANPHEPGTVSLVTSSPLMSYRLEPAPFFDALSEGLRLVAKGEGMDPHDPNLAERHSSIVRFVRTPNGDALGVLRTDGSVETWTVDHHGRGQVRNSLKINETGAVDQLVVLERGECFVTYSSSTGRLTLYPSQPSDPVSMDIPPITALFNLPSGNLPSRIMLIGVTTSQTVLLVNADIGSQSTNIAASLSRYEESSLPSSSLKMIIPVDPMGWTSSYSRDTHPANHDVLLSVSEDGELAFWIPERNKGTIKWRCTSRVNTGRKDIRMAACSSAKKSVLITNSAGGQELTIWDSKESEFASGLEFREVFSSADPVRDLDWTATPDSQSILAVGYAHRVELLCQQRMTYFVETPGWGLCWQVDLTSFIPHQISDSIWLRGGSLLIGAGHIMSVYGDTVTKENEPETETLFEYVARHNGPLDDYNPQMILQCLLWDKVELVKGIIVNLANNLEKSDDPREWEAMPVEEFLKKDEAAKASQINRKPQYSSLFSLPEVDQESDETGFSRGLVSHLMERLEEQPLPHLTPNEQQSLLVLIQTTLEVDEQRRALDSNGLRYLISMRVFHIYNRRLSAPTTPASKGSLAYHAQRRERLRYRDMIWAFHSESQDLLLSASNASCEGGKMCWPDARALGVYIWLQSPETMKAHMEVIARNQYLAGDNRDPTQCSLFYFALGKVKLVHGLWRQASWHKEQAVMLKFLANDFSQPRWRTAALKNAFALLSKRRFEYAAAFFLLGGSLKDAVNVCIRNLQDFQLAVALARVLEHGDDGPVLKEILTKTVIPSAFKEGNRWLASWAFWILRRRDLAVRILVTPLRDIATVWDPEITDIGGSLYDDPSLALLFSQLKLKTLQAAKGTSEISGRTEFNFVLQIARVFCRMGCQALALNLVRSWSFERPSTIVPESPVMRRPPSPLATRFALEPALRRQSSIMIDMDISTAPPTRSASPTRRLPNGAITGETMNEGDGDLVARKAGMGRLMKTAKQDVQVPEFDINAFF